MNHKQRNAIITIGTRIAIDNPKLLDEKYAQFIYMHPIDDISLHDKYTQYIKYEAGAEEGVVALLAYFFLTDCPVKYQKYLEDLDIGCLSGDSSVGEEELELLVESLADKKSITLIVGEDISGHKDFKNISKLLKLIDLYTKINIVFAKEDKNFDELSDIVLDEISDIHTYNGTVIYTVNSQEDILKGSASFAMAAKIKDGDTVNIIYEKESMKKKFMIDSSVRGTIALYPVTNINEKSKILSGYRFKQVKIQKVEV